MSIRVAERRTAISAGAVLSVVAGCIAYVLAKSMTTAGQATFDQIHYWILGFMPFILIGAYAYLSQRVFEGAQSEKRSAIGFYVSAWLCALIIFIVLRETHYSDSFQLPLYRKFGFENSFLEVIFSVVYVALGAALCIALAFVRGGRHIASRNNLLALTGLLVLNTLMFYLLVF